MCLYIKKYMDMEVKFVLMKICFFFDFCLFIFLGKKIGFKMLYKGMFMRKFWLRYFCVCIFILVFSCFKLFDW